jgi:integrase
MSRRANGEGTIAHRKDGRYVAAIYVPTAGGSKRIYLYGKTKAEVRDKLLEVRKEVGAGRPVPGTSPRVSDYLDYWLGEVIRPNKRPATHAEYKWFVENYLRPDLGAYALDQLTITVIQKWLNKIYAEGASHERPGNIHKVSADRIDKIRKVLSGMLTRAVQEELVPRNAAHFIVLPEYQKKEPDHWSVGEARQFLAGAVDHPLYGAYLMVLLYGLRRGEVLGVRWGDVDFEQGVLHIRNKLQRVGRVLLQGPPKTGAGRRTLPLLEPVRQALINIRAKYKQAVPEQLVFQKEGKPRDPDAVSVSFKRLAKRSGVKVIKLHEVRHTTATILKDLGVPARDTQRILGHANVTTTQQIYEHTSMENRQMALDQLQHALLPAYGQDLQRELPATGVSGCQLLSDQEIKRVLSAAIFALPTPVRIWCTWQDSNLRPLAPQIEKANVQQRVQGVRRCVDACSRAWLLGVIVVSIVVNS